MDRTIATNLREGNPNKSTTLPLHSSLTSRELSLEIWLELDLWIQWGCLKQIQIDRANFDMTWLNANLTIEYMGLY